MSRSVYTLPIKNDSSIISIEGIQQILENYRIGKKPLAKLLGWGETTILRYMEGDIPTNEYSEKLLQILNDPFYYQEVLLSGRNELTNIAYRKSLQAVQAIIFNSGINVVAQYIINRSAGDISMRRVQSVLYYSQGFSLVLNKHSLFQENIFISQPFVPYPVIYNSMKSCGAKVIELPENILSEADRTLIDRVYNTLDWYGPEAILRLMSRDRTQLIKIKSKTSDISISKESLLVYFTSIANYYSITNVKDINSYFNKRINEINKPRKA